MNALRFDVFGRTTLAIQREGGAWKAFVVGAEGKRSPASFVIPDFIEEGELEEFLFDLFHESAPHGGGEIKRIV